MSDNKARLTVTVDRHLAAYAERLVEAGTAPSVSAVVNGALREYAENGRRIDRQWREAVAAATDEDRAKAARLLARQEEQDARLPGSHRLA